MPDKQFIPLGSESAPADWVIPGSLTITPEAVFANFDGTGASGAFLPTLEIISDSGHTIAEIPMDSSVAMGSSVDATWGPFLESRKTSGTTSTVGAFGHIAYSTASWANNPAEGTATVPFASSAFFTSDASIYAYGTNGGFGGIQVNKAGWYLLFFTSECNSGVAPAANACLQVVPNHTSIDSVVTQFTSPFFEQDATDFLANAEWTILVEFGGSGVALGTVVTEDVGQNSGGSVSLTANMTFVQLST